MVSIETKTISPKENNNNWENFNFSFTKISPHNEDAEWIYYSENVKTGKRVKVNMEKMIRRLEQITGETFFEIDEPNKLKP